MADPLPEPDLDPNGHDNVDAPYGHGSTTGRPRWMRVLWIVVALGVVALVIVLHVTGTLGPGAH